MKVVSTDSDGTVDNGWTLEYRITNIGMMFCVVSMVFDAAIVMISIYQVIRRRYPDCQKVKHWQLTISPVSSDYQHIMTMQSNQLQNNAMESKWNK
jgi:hypothetical protein